MAELELSDHSHSARVLYDGSANRWARTHAESLSDYTARAPLLPLLEPLAGKRVLDLGCGEGYCARRLKGMGARAVTAIDISEQMIALAKAEEAREPLGIDYAVGSATALASIGDASTDAVLAMFLYNYLGIAELRASMREVHRVLAPGGSFLFSVPHPMFALLCRPEPPFYFDAAGAGYFSARDRCFAGRIWKRDGTPLEVRVVHKTLEDYFGALASAGFQKMPRVHELGVTEAMIELDPRFFGPLRDLPLHLAMEVDR